MQTISVLSRHDIEQLVDMKEAIALMRSAFAELSRGNVTVPVRMNLGIPEHGGRALFMPVYSPLAQQVAQKIVMVYPDNVQAGLPFIHALVLLFDATRGVPLALMDGESITALRTGAASGLATDLLAHRDASTLAVFGTGVQARTQLSAIMEVRTIVKLLVFGRSQDKAAAFALESAEAFGIDAIVATHPSQLAEADVICTATTSLTPVFDPHCVKPGCHINGVGSFRPDMTEIPSETVCRAAVFVDQRVAALEEAGDLIVPISKGLIGADHIRAELGEVVLGTAEGRSSPEEVTFFKSVGNAIQDLAVASYLEKEAKSRADRAIGNTVQV